MRFNAIICTYKSRNNYLKQCIKSLGNLCEKIIIVNNDPKKITEFQDENILILEMGYNAGSAMAFSEGMKLSSRYSPKNMMILLDDDNYLIQDLSSIDLLKILNYRCNDITSHLFILNRIDRKYYQEAVDRLDPYYHINGKSSFLGINIFKSILISDKVYPYDLCCGPYGGSVIHPNLLEVIGYPDKSFFVYKDDLEWSNRVILNGRKIYFLDSVHIKDQEISFDIKNYQSPYKRFINLSYDERYQINNSLRVCTLFKESNVIYNLNRSAFLILSFINIRTMKNLKNWCYILKYSFN